MNAAGARISTDMTGCCRAARYFSSNESDAAAEILKFWRGGIERGRQRMLCEKLKTVYEVL